MPELSTQDATGMRHSDSYTRFLAMSWEERYWECFDALLKMEHRAEDAERVQQKLLGGVQSVEAEKLRLSLAMRPARRKRAA